jgi:hypothetical protein
MDVMTVSDAAIAAMADHPHAGVAEAAKAEQTRRREV